MCHSELYIIIFVKVKRCRKDTASLRRLLATCNEQFQLSEMKKKTKQNNEYNHLTFWICYSKFILRSLFLVLVTSRYLLCCLQCCLTFNVNNRGCFTHCFTSIIQKQITLNECIIVVDCNKMEAFLKASVIQLTLSYSNRYYSNLFIIRLNSKSPSILKA